MTNLKKFPKILKKTCKKKCPCYYFSNGIANLCFFFEIRDQGVINGLNKALILKSETKMGRKRGVGRLCLVKIIKVS